MKYGAVNRRPNLFRLSLDFHRFATVLWSDSACSCFGSCGGKNSSISRRLWRRRGLVDPADRYGRVLRPQSTAYLRPAQTITRYLYPECTSDGPPGPMHWTVAGFEEKRRRHRLERRTRGCPRGDISKVCIVSSSRGRLSIPLRFVRMRLYICIVHFWMYLNTVLDSLLELSKLSINTSFTWLSFIFRVICLFIKQHTVVIGGIDGHCYCCN